METYGFTDPSFVDPETYKSFQISYSTVLKRRHARWKSFFDNGILQRSPKLKRFCRKGIPSAFRADAWLSLSGARDNMRAHPDVYKTAVLDSPPSHLQHTILADVPRTFPENIFFGNPADSHSKVNSLQRVLSAFAIAFPKIGYCQGLNYVAATLLLVLSGSNVEVEEKAFWLLEALTHQILPSYYTTGMVDVQVDCRVFEELLKIKVNNAHTILQESSVDCVLLATKWFICLFVDVLPIQTVLRIFDCIFYEGDKILFRACIALVKLHLDDIAKCGHFPDVLLTFRNMCHDSQTLFCHEFMQAMFKLPGSLSMRKISSLRQRFLLDVEKNMSAAEERAKEYRRRMEQNRAQSSDSTDSVNDDSEAESNQVVAGVANGSTSISFPVEANGSGA